MDKRIWLVLTIALIVTPLVIVGCKGKVEKTDEAQITETTEAIAPAGDTQALMEPAQTVATETIPPTAAAPQAAAKPAVSAEKEKNNKDIQKALKNAGLYTGPVDGKIGPKTKKAIEEFQNSKGLKADGKVGPKTWAELEKYLTQ